MPTRSRMRSASRRSWPGRTSTSALRRNCATATRPVSRPRRIDMLRFLAGFFLVLSALFGAQDPVQWKLTFDAKSAPPGSKILGHLTAKIEPGWHLYSLTTPRPPIATTVGLADSPVVAGVKVYQPQPVVKMDPTFNVNTETFGEEVVFLLEIELKKDAPAGDAELTAQVRYQCCNDNTCLPP